MKLYSKSNLWSGILCTFLGLLYLWQNRGQLDTLVPVDWFILACVSASACIYFYTAFSKKHGMRAFIQENDEREKIFQLKIYRTSFWTGLIGLFLIGWFFRTHAGNEAMGYTGRGIQLSALLLFLFHVLICGAYRLLHTCEQTETSQ